MLASLMLWTQVFFKFCELYFIENNLISLAGQVLPLFFGFFFFCSNAGVSRSATIVIAYIMKYQKLKFEEAFTFVKQRRLVKFFSFNKINRAKIQPNQGFIKQLKQYEKKLNVD